MKNPFLFKTRPYPIKLIVDIHSYCNARCRMCPYPKYSRKQSQGTMDWNLYTAIIDEFTQLGKTHNFKPILTYCYMGEPFLAENLEEYAQYAIDRDINLYLNTNASAMTPEKVNRLLNTGFSGKIHVSFHGVSPDVYEKIMGLDYQTSLDNTLYLIDNYDTDKILIRGVDDHWPEGEAEKWRQFWQPKNVELEYLPPISRCGSVGRLLPKKLKEKNQVRLYGCKNHWPLVEMIILFNGDTVMCCQDMGREYSWGSVKEKGLLGVWNDRPRQEALQMIYQATPVSKSFLCARCEEALGPIDLAQTLASRSWKKLTNPLKPKSSIK